jgi:hypothetical protein
MKFISDKNLDAIAKHITEDQSLWQLWRKAQTLKVPLFNRLFFWLFFSIMIYIVYFTEINYISISNSLYQFADIGFTYSTIMLGFAATGFTIFSSFSSSDYLLNLAYFQHPSYNLSFLKIFVCAYMNTFIILLTFMFMCFFVLILGSKNGLLQHIVADYDNYIVYEIIVKSYFMFFISFFVLSILLVKSLIFNVYQTIMISVRYNFEKQYLKYYRIKRVNKKVAFT